jgi:hypothetical protein
MKSDNFEEERARKAVASENKVKEDRLLIGRINKRYDKVELMNTSLTARNTW